MRSAKDKHEKKQTYRVFVLSRYQFPTNEDCVNG